MPRPIACIDKAACRSVVCIEGLFIHPLIRVGCVAAAGRWDRGIGLNLDVILLNDRCFVSLQTAAAQQ